MSVTTIEWPVKTREIANALFDSTRWNGFDFRDGDAIVATWSKSGTTWTQQIVWQLFNGAPEGVFSMETCPMVEFRPFEFGALLSALAAQQTRRCLKTHLPVDGLVFSPKARYLYVGRDARDVIWSAHNHQTGFSDAGLGLLNAEKGDWPPVTRPTDDVRGYYLHWLEHDDLPGFPFHGVSFWDHVQGWWNIRALPNVLLVHFNNLKADLKGEIERIARFLEVEVDDAQWPAILEHCSFSYMQSQGAGGLDVMFKGGAKTFFNKGANGRWRDVLSTEEVARCDDVAAHYLTPDCARWLANGELPAS
jgi:aryl sulfotransferase